MMALLTSRQNGTPLRDLALYVAIAFVIGIVVIFLAQTDLSHEAYIKWGGLAVNTSALFGYFIADSRQWFDRRSFWLLSSASLLLHLGAFVAVLTHISQWKLVWFMVMYLEMPVLLYLRSLLVRTSGK
jgi:hypothetical protein